MTSETDDEFVADMEWLHSHDREAALPPEKLSRLFDLARRGAAVQAETAALRKAMALKIDEKQFLDAVDREGDYECGAGKFADDKRAYSTFANSENASKGEQRTICEACGNANLSHDRAAWADDGASYCPKCFQIILADPLPPPPSGEQSDE